MPSIYQLYSCHPSSQDNHLKKLLITTIVAHILNTIHNITIQKVQVHTNIFENDEANK
jgi:hypothetical protein